MSHRKRVRAYWNRVAREKRFEMLRAELPQLFKRIFGGSRLPRELIYKGAPLLAVLKPERER